MLSITARKLKNHTYFANKFSGKSKINYYKTYLVTDPFNNYRYIQNNNSNDI